MKNLFFLMLLLLSSLNFNTDWFEIFQADIFVDATNGSDTNSGSWFSPVQTIAQANTLSTTGDRIGLKAGQTFSETVTVPGNSRTYKKYGRGADPIISGFTTVTGWTKRSTTDVYVKYVSTTITPEILTVNDVQYAKGRTPNSNEYNLSVNDYYHIDSYTTTSITDSECNSATTDWDNADLIVRGSGLMTYHKFVITSHSGTTLNFSNPTSYALGTGYGYWIQNDLRTLDQFGEWYFNPTTDTLYFYGNPAGYTVNISTKDKLIDVNTRDYITVKNIQFEGANSTAITTAASSSEAYNLTVANCYFDFNMIGVYGHLSPEVTVKNSIFKRTSKTPMYIHWYPDGTHIANNLIDSTGLTLGVGISTTDNSNFYIGMGMYINYAKHLYSNKHVIIENNTVLNSAYSGIVFSGDSAIVRKNFIKNSVVNKADGGGIYYGGQNVFKNITIEDNIVLNSLNNTDKHGLPTGTTSNNVHGIYLDYNSDGVITVQNNSVGNIGGGGVYLHMSDSVSVLNNTVYNAYYALKMQELETYNHPLRLNVIKHNKIINDTTNNYLIWARSLNADFNQTGIIDSNYYATDIRHSTPVGTAVASWSFDYRSFDGWKTYSSQDANSYYSTNTGLNTIFDYNNTSTSKTVAVSGRYMTADSVVYNNASYTLQPWKSIVLMKDTVLNINIDSIYAAYPLNANLQDSVASQDGTNSGAVITANGKFQEAYDFDNLNDYAYFPINTGTLNNASYSISMWVKLDILPSVAGVGYYLISDIKSGTSYKMILSVNTSNTLGIAIRNSDLSLFSSNSVGGAISSTGQWYHIVVNVPSVGQAGQLFINGARSIGGTNQTVTGTNRTTDYRFYLGSYTGTTGLDGQIDDVVIRNCWTTADEANYIYNAGAGKYYPFTE